MFRDNHINILLGPIASAAIAVAPIAAQQHVINISPSTAAQALMGQPKYPLLFSEAPSLNWRAGAAVAGVLHWFPNTKKVAFMAPDDATDQALFPVVTTLLTSNNIASQYFDYPPNATDLSTVATKVAAYNPDLIFTSGATGSVQQLTNVFHSIDAAGIPKSVNVFAWTGGPDMATQAAGRAYVGQVTYSTDFVTQKSPDILAFEAALAQKLGLAPTALTSSQLLGASLYANVVPLMAQAISSANTTSDVNAIAASMLRVSATGLGAVKLQWGPDHNLNFPIVSDMVDAQGMVHTAHLTP